MNLSHYCSRKRCVNLFGVISDLIGQASIVKYENLPKAISSGDIIIFSNITKNNVINPTLCNADKSAHRGASYKIFKLILEIQKLVKPMEAPGPGGVIAYES